MKNTKNLTETLKTFKCQNCGKETPSKSGRTKYCLECGILINRQETALAMSEIRKEELRIKLANQRIQRAEAERLAFLAELQGEHYSSKLYTSNKELEDEFNDGW